MRKYVFVILSGTRSRRRSEMERKSGPTQSVRVPGGPEASSKIEQRARLREREFTIKHRFPHQPSPRPRPQRNRRVADRCEACSLHTPSKQPETTYPKASIGCDALISNGSPPRASLTHSRYLGGRRYTKSINMNPSFVYAFNQAL